MNMNRSRPIFNSVSQIRVSMSTKSRQATHYETLNVNQDCTQDDIKSSYYELSKKYHPDKNKSTDAKKHFQSVSDAYEVLGNFSKRKQYDRDLAARGVQATVNRPEYDAQDDPLASLYRSRMSNYDPVKAYETRANFDFEAWTQAHYGQTFRRTLKDKRSKFIRHQMRLDHLKETEQNKSTLITVSLATIIIMLGLMIQSWSMSDRYDRNLIDKERSENKKS